MVRCFGIGRNLKHGSFQRNFPRNEVNQGAQKYKKVKKKSETVLSPSTSFDCEFGRGGEGEAEVGSLSHDR